jgi:hypothetical protein
MAEYLEYLDEVSAIISLTSAWIPEESVSQLADWYFKMDLQNLPIAIEQNQSRCTTHKGRFKRIDLEADWLCILTQSN